MKRQEVMEALRRRKAPVPGSTLQYWAAHRLILAPRGKTSAGDWAPEAIEEAVVARFLLSDKPPLRTNPRAGFRRKKWSTAEVFAGRNLGLRFKATGRSFKSDLLDMKLLDPWQGGLAEAWLIALAKAQFRLPLGRAATFLAVCEEGEVFFHPIRGLFSDIDRIEFKEGDFDPYRPPPL